MIPQRHQRFERYIKVLKSVNLFTHDAKYKIQLIFLMLCSRTFFCIVFSIYVTFVNAIIIVERKKFDSNTGLNHEVNIFTPIC